MKHWWVVVRRIISMTMEIWWGMILMIEEIYHEYVCGRSDGVL